MLIMVESNRDYQGIRVQNLEGIAHEAELLAPLPAVSGPL